MTWGWRKILALRDLLRPYMWKSIGSGNNTNVWSDTWCTACPIRAYVSPRTIANAGFNLQNTVAELVDSNGHWRWPIAWFDLFPVLINIQAPVLNDAQDRLVWINYEGKAVHFSSWEVWNNIRHRENIVDWFNMVWFKQCIPRHSFNLWLVIRNKLKTQDRLTIWEAGSATNLNLMCCPLCNHGKDSRDHLFFECFYSSEVWNSIKDMAGMGDVNGQWNDIMQWMNVNSNMQKPANFYGTHSKPPTLESIEDYTWWKERFINWAKA
ncbi:uncharacterized protein LOC110906641 [Helianthus annuus]|uniref:uncharacterized protein LOC110906641 n=1 Tax=Helianthus annuus TaxID=4232 RepID=UPI000B904A58|nr:uncharacterized protein LOC110906641 [Helianthus annuus]